MVKIVSLRKLFFSLFILQFLLPMAGCVSAVDAIDKPEPYGERADVRAFAENLVKEEGFEMQAVMAILSKGQYQQGIIDAITRPAEKVLKWDEYQDIFLTRSREKGGRKFMRQFQDDLKRAENTYGVPGEIIVAILGVETRYGELRGGYRVLDALMTLGFDYPPRAEFFRSQLREFFLMTREEGSDPMTLMGSYAGAMGYGQFIPSSFRHYAIDFDGDGVKDIWDNPVDGIGSVANYLSEHGWKQEEKVVVRAFNVREEARELFTDNYKPETSFEALKTLGVRTRQTFPGEALVSPLLFNGKRGQEYWIGLNNFYVITRYNRSKLYAMAVYQLSQRIMGQTAG